jgi:hypothetical protein
MREALDKLLYKKYPLLYQQRNLSPRETLMCWGFTHGDGWYGIIDAISATLTALDPEAQTIQVKEKFGTLSYYLSARVCHDMVIAAENYSGRVCEETGYPGQMMVSHGWYSTLSPEAVKERLRGSESRGRSEEFKVVPVGKGDWPPGAPPLEVRRAFTKTQAIEALRKRHKGTLKDSELIDLPAGMFDLADVCVLSASQKTNFFEKREELGEQPVVKITKLFYRERFGLWFEIDQASLEPVVRYSLEHKFKLDDPDRACKIIDELPAAIAKLRSEIDAVRIFCGVMSNRVDSLNGRVGPVDDEGNLIVENKPAVIDENTKVVFSLVASFTPRVDTSPIVFGRKTIKNDNESRKLFKQQLRLGNTKIVLPHIYAARRIYMPFDTPPMAHAIAWALAVEHGWRVALPVEIAKFLLGKRERPDEDEVRVFLYDEPEIRLFEKYGFSFLPAADMSLFDLTVAGQAIRLGRDKADENMNDIVQIGRFAANAWFRNEPFTSLLTQDLESGKLTGYDQLLALAIREELLNPQQISRVAPKDFNPAEHQDAATVKGWRLNKRGDGSECISALSITGHPHIADGERLARSTDIVWIDETSGWARTRSRVYKLLDKDEAR